MNKIGRLFKTSIGDVYEVVQEKESGYLLVKNTVSLILEIIHVSEIDGTEYTWI